MKYETTATRLRTALGRSGMTQQQLADASGVSKSAISHCINGRHTITNLTAKPMAQVLKVNPLWLMGFDVEMVERPDEIDVPLSADEVAIIDRYRKADDTTKSIIRKILNIEVVSMEG